MASYNGMTNTTTLENIDTANISELTSVDITCDNLTVTTAIYLPNLVISDSEIVGMSSSKLIGYVNANQVGTGVVDNTEFNLLNGLTAPIATESNTLIFSNKSISGLTNTLTNIQDSSLSSNVVTLNGFQTLTNKVIINPSIDAIVNDGGILSIPATITDTFVFKNLLAVLTNKTISGLSNTITNIQDSSLSSNIVTLTSTQSLSNKTLTTPIISSISNTGTITLPTATCTLVGKDTTDILTNKTISGASNTLSSINATSISTGTITNTMFNYLYGLDQNLYSTSSPNFSQVFLLNGCVASRMINQYLTFSATLNLPSASIGGGSTCSLYCPQLANATTDTFLCQAFQATITNKLLNTSSVYFSDNADATKKIAFDASGITTGTTRTLTSPNASGTIVLNDNTATLTNKTLTSPIISTISNTGTLTLPTATCTLVGKDTTDILSNKKLVDNVTTIVENVDNTKILSFKCQSMSTGTALVLTPTSTTSQTLNLPNITTTDTVAVLGLAQTLSSKTLASPAFSGTSTGVINNSDSTASTSTSTGSLILSGGIGCAKSIFADYIAAKGQYNCRMVKNASTGRTVSAWGAVTGLSSANDTGFQSQSGAMADNANSRVLIPIAGKYLITGIVGVTTGICAVGIEKNGLGVGGQDWYNNGSVLGVSYITISLNLAANDTIKLWVFNNTAVTNVGDAAYNKCHLCVALL